MSRLCLRAALLGLLLVGGCRSAYDGPSFAGEWVTPPREDGKRMSLLLTQDLAAFFNEPVHGELTDVEGHTWDLAGEPHRQNTQGLVAGNPVRIGLRDPLVLLTDQGELRTFDSGPLPWKLVRGALDGGIEAITLHVGRGGPLWTEPDPDSWAHCTFHRAGAIPFPTPLASPVPPAAAPASPDACASCGVALQAEWRHCPMCGLDRR